MHPSDSHLQSMRLQRQLNAAQRISQALFRHHPLDQIVEKALTIAMEVADAQAGSILLSCAGTQQLVFQYTIGHLVPAGTSIPWNRGIAGAVYHSGNPEVIQDVKKDPRHFRAIDAIDGFVTRDLITVPLKQGEGRPIGVLQVLNKRQGSLDEEDLLILTVISAFTALAIEQARLSKEAKLGEIARLLGDIGHDVNNMLTPVVIGARCMESDLKELFKPFPALDLEQARSTQERCTIVLEMIRNSSRRIQDRVKQIADCVKGQSGPPYFQSCMIAGVVDSVMSTLRVMAEEKGITLRTEGLETLPPLWADEMRLYNAFYNLVNNALAEVPSGGSITVRGAVDTTAGLLHLAVADTGRGMPPEIRDSLFSSRAISRKHGGTGLGTRIVKDVVDAHDGTITVESQENVGTTFHMRLPLGSAGLNTPDDRLA